ncbi:unnamed protein product [Arabidopsis halleri]
MELLARDVDSGYASRLQIEEALAASLSSGFRNPQSPLPPIVDTSGAGSEDVRLRNRGFDFGETVVQGKRHETSPVSGVHRDVLYRLYFKGLADETIGEGKVTNVVAGFGVAICDLSDNLLFELKGPLVDGDKNRQGAEIRALTRGLTEALKLRITHIAIFCHSYPIFQFVIGKWVPKQKKIIMLMRELQQIRKQFTVSQLVLVATNEVKFAYKLATESIVYQLTPHEDPRPKELCIFCYNDTGAELMFSVNRCRHRLCFQCLKLQVEVKLLQGMLPTCPHDGCKSKLDIDACNKLLCPKLSEIWKHRIKENAIPVTERVYCPYPRCSALMSKTKISVSAKSLLSAYPGSGFRRCVECCGLFCVDCKVPWHGELSCTEYKRLHPNLLADDVKLKSLANHYMWRQCGKCQHMIELSDGCNQITCRCGFELCYNCGGGWNKKMGTCTKLCPPWNDLPDGMGYHHELPVHASANREGQAGEPGQSHHFPRNNAQF